jgi:hypothetical protein
MLQAVAGCGSQSEPHAAVRCSAWLSTAAFQLPAHFEATNTACHTPTWRRVFALWARAIGISVLDGIVNRSFSSEPLRSFYLLRCRNGHILGFPNIHMRKLVFMRQFPCDAMASLRVLDGLLVCLTEEHVAIAEGAMPNVVRPSQR